MITGDLMSRSRLPELNAISAFEAFAHYLDFGIAAEHLGMTVLNVKGHIKRLEADLGVELLDRSSEPPVLTRHGRRYADRLRRLIETMVKSTMALRPQTIVLTINVTPHIAAKWLGTRLGAFAASHPGIDLRPVVTEEPPNYNVDFDFALRPPPRPFTFNAEAERFSEDDFVAVGSPSLLGAWAGLLTGNDFGRFNLLDDPNDMWSEFARRVLGLPTSVSVARESFESTSLAIEAAVAGRGLAVVRPELVEQHLTKGLLVLATKSQPKGCFDSYLAWAHRPRHPKAAQTVRQWLLRQRDAALCPVSASVT